MISKEYSKNQMAFEIVGKRPVMDGVVPFDQPCELGYHCPVCEYQIIHSNGMDCFDERLHWSEYNGFLWCEVCNKDYPTCMCVPLDKPLPKYVTEQSPIDYAIEIFLKSVSEAANKIA